MIRQFLKFNCAGNTTFNRYCVKENLHTTTLVNVAEKTQELENNHIATLKEVVDKYGQENAEKMLKIINNYDLNQLLGYEISTARANNLLSWRTRYGTIKSLSDVLSIEGFGLKVADKFFKSLLLEPKEQKLPKSKKRAAAFITPVLDTEQRQTIRSAVGVRIGVSSITWSRLEIPELSSNEPCLLTHWEHHEIAEKKLHINELIQRCLYINHAIPVADCYLFENPQVAVASNDPGSIEQQNISIQKAQVNAIMGYALAARRNLLYEETDNENDVYKNNNLPNVFYVRRFLPSRLFNRFVGSERVSSEETILNLMRTFYDKKHLKDFVPLPSEKIDDTAENNLNFSGRVQFPMELRVMFSKSPRYYREFLSQSLLLNLAFVRLVLLQNADSIATVSKSGR